MTIDFAALTTRLASETEVSLTEEEREHLQNLLRGQAEAATVAESKPKPVRAPTSDTARKMAAAAREREHTDVADYLEQVAGFLDTVAGSVFIPDLNPGDEITVARKTTIVVPR